jgi:putative nucleotidyltransferase with HDIG domain
MILTTSVVDVFLNGPGGRLFSRTDFWHHSLACAIASKIICRHLQGDEEEAFAAGLLHDIGKVIIDQYVTDKFIHILSQTRKFHISILNVETEVLGFNHLDTGTMIAQKWMLPASITEVIRYHHEPACAPRFPGLAAVVNIANSLAQAMEIGNSGNRFVPLVEPGLFSWLQMAIDLIEPIMEQTRQQFDKITDQMNQLV